VGVGLRKGRPVGIPVDHATKKMATEATSASRRKADAPTAAQTGFNARDRLAGRLDDATVRQAAEGGR